MKDIEKEEKNFLKAPLYLYGTEAIGSYYRLLNLKGKSVLTVNGSGDQVLNAYFFGAKKVIGFDLVKNTKYLLDLKMSAIKNLSRLEFLSFFGDIKDLGDFDYDTYCSLEKDLEKESAEFFQELFKNYNFDGSRLINSDDFRKRKEFYGKLFVVNPFLASDANYRKIRKSLGDVKMKFVKSDIYDIHNVVKEKFDFINLSNVLNYISKDLVKRNVRQPLEDMYDKILINLKKKLNPKKGRIFYYSFYRRPQEIEDTPLINQVKSFEWMKSRGNFEVSKKDFEGILFGRDWITVLENKK